MANPDSNSRYSKRFSPAQTTFMHRGQVVSAPWPYPAATASNPATDAKYLVERQDVGALDLGGLSAYGTERLWWVLAAANGIIDPEDLVPGAVIAAPVLR